MQHDPRHHSLWRYLMLLALLPFAVWQASQFTLTQMDVAFARGHPQLDLSMAQACAQTAPAQGAFDRCPARLRVATAHHLALGILVTLAAMLALAASVRAWPRGLRIGVLRHAKWFAGAALILTWLMVAARGAAAALAVWALPLAWWEREFAGFAAIIAVFAVCRLPRHAMAGWRLMTDIHRFVVGQITSPDRVPEIGAMIDRAAARLGTRVPERLILGLRPGARLETGTFLLEPRSQRMRGRTLYLGITLAQALNTRELESLIQSALSRAAGPYGEWLAEVQDALADAHDALDAARLARRNSELGGETDPALDVFAAWLAWQLALLVPFEEADLAAACERQAAGTFEMERTRAAALIGRAQRAWHEKVFARFMLALSVGEKSPPTQQRFDSALVEAGETHCGKGMRWCADAGLYAQLVVRDCEWMAATGQVALIGESWELLGIYGAHKQDVAKPWDFSLRLNP